MCLTVDCWAWSQHCPPFVYVRRVSSCALPAPHSPPFPILIWPLVPDTLPTPSPFAWQKALSIISQPSSSGNLHVNSSMLKSFGDIWKSCTIHACLAFCDPWFEHRAKLDHLSGLLPPGLSRPFTVGLSGAKQMWADTGGGVVGGLNLSRMVFSAVMSAWQ